MIDEQTLQLVSPFACLLTWYLGMRLDIHCGVQLGAVLQQAGP